MRGLLGVCATLLLTGVVQACPPLPTPAQWNALADEGEEGLGQTTYAIARLMKCSWSEARPAFVQLLQRPRAPDDEQEDLAVLLMMFSQAPPKAVAAFAESALDELPAAIRALDLAPGERAQAARNIEQALPGMVDLAENEPTLSPLLVISLDLLLVSREAQAGHLEAARARLARIEHGQAHARLLASKGDADVQADEVRETLDDFHRALFPEPVASAETTGAGWVLDRSTQPQRRCGFVGLGDAFNLDSLKANARGAEKDVDGALAELLEVDWRGQIGGKPRHTDELVKWARQRYSDAQLRQAWSDAEASLRVGDGANGLVVFGRFLPLPSAVREDDPARAGAVRERPLQHDEALALVRGTALHRALLAPVPAR
jgi:hypothetical protein